MEQRDYLMRQIEQAGRALAKVMADLTGLKNQGKVHEGIEQAEQSLQDELDLSIEKMTGIPLDQFIHTLKEKEHMFAENFEQTADLLVEIAEGYRQQGSLEKSRALYQRALVLYEYVEEAGSSFSFNRHSRMQKIKELLQQR